MLNNWQEQQAIEKENRAQEKIFSIATVNAVYADGITLTFPGESPGIKKYKHNLDATFSVGDKVVAAHMSGTYVVICKI